MLLCLGWACAVLGMIRTQHISMSEHNDESDVYILCIATHHK